jgi:maltoporin
MTTATYNGKVNTVNNAGDEYDFSWFNVAARPIYKINENFELQFEAGYTMYNDENTDNTGGIGKLTFAPTYKFNTNEFFERPELRVFVTYAHWNDDYDEDMHDTLGDYSNQDGLNFGIQAEVWF